MKDGTLFQEKENSLYIYQQTTQNTIFTGIIAATSVDDYLNGNIKIHEQTITKREEMFKNYLKTTGFNAEPVLLTYKDNNTIENIISENEVSQNTNLLQQIK